MDESWREHAACLGSDTNLFFAEGRGNYGTNRSAKEVCRPCPVREPCTDLALDTSTTHGVFGGKTHPERRKYAKRRAIADSTGPEPKWPKNGPPARPTT